MTDVTSQSKKLVKSTKSLLYHECFYLQHFTQKNNSCTSCMPMFERSREIDRKKKNDRPRIEPVSQQNKLASSHFSALFACTNEATVRELCNYMNNKTSGKYHASVTSSFSKTKVSVVFRSTKDLQKIPLEN